MRMTPEENSQLVAILEKQNDERIKFIEDWKRNTKRKTINHQTYVEDEYTICK